MKKATTAAVTHWPITSAATTPTVISVWEVTWPCSPARATPTKAGQPTRSTTSTPIGKGTEWASVSDNPIHSPDEDDQEDGTEQQPRGANRAAGEALHVGCLAERAPEGRAAAGTE